MADLRDFTGKNRKFTGTIGERISTGSTAERDDSTFGAGTLRFNTTTNLMEYYTGTEWKSIDAPPTITFVSINGGADTTSGEVDNEASGNVTIEVKGSLFDTTSGNVTFVGTSETLTPVIQTRNSSGLFTCELPASSFDDANSPYTVKMTNGSGLSAELVAGISSDQAAPAFITAAGTLGTISDSTRSSYTLSSAAAIDADGDTITYSISAGSLPAGLSLNSSTAAITGTASLVGSNTTSTFTVSAATAASTSTRQFTITVNAPVVTQFTSTGAFTYSVPAGVSSVRVMVVGGGGGANSNNSGGGGAGGMIDVPSFPVTPGGTVPGSVGAGGPQGTNTGQNSTFGSLTALGGGGGGNWQGSGQAGGSGGGGAGNNGPTISGSPGQQPGQPGQSGTFGYGNPGGAGTAVFGGDGGGGGGGGAAQAGGPGQPFWTGPFGRGGEGGNGRQSNITGSNVYYAGGGGAGGGGNFVPQGSAPGGQGGGGNGCSGPGRTDNQNGQANTGGGGGGGDDSVSSAGGSGIVIVAF